MVSRQRVHAALEFRAVDVVPLQIYAAPGGLYEHGQKLVDLTKACGHDFGDFQNLTMPEPPKPEDFDEDGSYHAIKTDDWGTTWEFRIFGIWGHPIAWPLNDLANLPTYQPPATPPCQGEEFQKDYRKAQAHKEKYYLLNGGYSLLEKLYSLRRFEDVLMDVTLDTPEMNRIADMLVEKAMAGIARDLALGADGIHFGDDFGTQLAPLLSPAIWRRFFKPRYKALFEPIHNAGKKIFFHSCGQITAFLEDFKDLGVSAIWPQLPVFDLKELATISKDLHLAIQLHPDRGDLMQRSRPEDVRTYVRKLMDIFDTPSGGSWLYIEIDPGFPYGNVEALFETAMELRR